MGREKHDRKPIGKAGVVSDNIHPDDERYAVHGSSHKAPNHKKPGKNKGRDRMTTSDWLDEVDNNIIDDTSPTKRGSSRA